MPQFIDPVTGAPFEYNGPEYQAGETALTPDFGLPATLPSLGGAINARRGWLGPGLKSGVQNIGGALAAGVGAVGGAIGADSVRDWGIEQSRAFQQRAAEQGREDLNVMPWSKDWGAQGKTWRDLPEWLGYQVAQQVPQFGLAMAGGALVGGGMKAAGLMAPGAEVAATLPTYLGGAGLKAGASFAERKAALAAGQDLAQQFAGTAIAGLPQAAGSMYQEEIERADRAGEKPRQGAALAALAASPLYSALDAISPTSETGMLKRGLEGGLARRVVTAGLSEGVQETFQEAAQTGMEMAFRPDLSAPEKAQNIIDAAITGGLVGGVIGAPGGIRRLSKADPSEVSTRDLGDVTREELKEPATPAPATPPGAPVMPAEPLSADERKQVLIDLETYSKALTAVERKKQAVDAPEVNSQALTGFYTKLQQNGPTLAGADARSKALAIAFGLADEAGNIRSLDEARAALELQRGPQQLDMFGNATNAAGPIDARISVIDAMLANQRGEDVTTFALGVVVPSRTRIRNTRKAEPPPPPGVETPTAAEIANPAVAPPPEFAPAPLKQDLRRQSRQAAAAPAPEEDQALTDMIEAARARDAALAPAAGPVLKQDERRASFNATNGERSDGLVSYATPKDMSPELADIWGRLSQTFEGADADKAAVAQGYQASIRQKLRATGALSPQEIQDLQYALDIDGIGEPRANKEALATPKFSIGAVPQEVAYQLAVGKNDLRPGVLDKELKAKGEVRIGTLTARQNGKNVDLFDGEQPIGSIKSMRELQKQLVRGGAHEIAPQLATPSAIAQPIPAAAPVAAATPQVTETPDAVSVGSAEAPVLGENAKARGAVAEGNAAGTPAPAQGPAVVRKQDLARRSAKAAQEKVAPIVPEVAPVKEAVTAYTPEQTAAVAKAEKGGLLERAQNLITNDRPRSAEEISQGLDGKLTPQEVAAIAAVMPGSTMTKAAPVQRPAMQRSTTPSTGYTGQGMAIESLYARARQARPTPTISDAKAAAKTPDAADFLKWRAKNGGKLKGVRLDAAGQAYVQVNGREVPIYKDEWTVGTMLDAFLKASNGDKRLRAISGTLRRFAADKPVLVAAHKDIKEATGYTSVYDPESDVIVLPADLNDEQTLHVFAHEAVHSALHRQIESSRSASTQLMQLAQHVVDKAGADRSAYAFKNAHEFLSEGLSDAKLQSQLERTPISAREAYRMGVGDARNGFSALLNMAAEWLGWRAPINGLEAIMRIQKQLADGENVMPQGVKEFIDEKLQGIGISDLEHLLTETNDRKIAAGKQVLMEGARQIVADADANLHGLTLDIDKKMAAIAEKPLNADSDLRKKIRTAELYWSSFGHIAQKFGRLFTPSTGDVNKNPLVQYGDHMAQRATLTAQFARLWTDVNDTWLNLQKRKPKLAAKLRDALDTVMSLSTEFAFDPDRPFDDQIHLMTSHNVAELRKAHAEAAKALQFIRQQEGNGADRDKGVFNKLRSLNNVLMYSYQAVQLYNMVRSDSYLRDAGDALTLTKTDPVEAFLRDNSLQGDAAAAEKYWRKAVTDRMDETIKYLNAKNDAAKAAGVTKEDKDALKNSHAPIRKMIDDMKVAMLNIERSPYFHLGRHGDHIVRFDLRADPDKPKVVDQAALRQVVERLKPEFPTVRISGATDQYHVMARFEDADTANRFHDAIVRLSKDGLVQAGSIQSAQVDTNRDFDKVQPQWLQKYLENIDSNPDYTPGQKQAMIAAARIAWLDLLPDTAVARVMAQRHNVPGYYSDMLRNFAFRAEVGTNALANLSIAAKVREDFTSMKAMLKDAQYAPERRAEAMIMKQVIDELETRDASRPNTVGKDWVDTLRAANHTFFLGMSPAYTLINMTQLGVLLWPELAKQPGVSFVKAAKTIASVTPAALKLIGATFDEGRKLGWSRALDAIITDDVLKKALPDNAEMRDFLHRMIISGKIDLGSPMRELGRTSDNRQDTTTDHALRIASAMGYYSETLTRLIAAMSAYELHKGKSAEQIDRYALTVLDDAMLNYSNWYTARATGKAGVLGKFTPVPASFQQYTLQVLQKLYREIYDAYSSQQPGEAPEAVAERKTAARRFLMGHSAAMVALAGTLGMPFTSVALRLVDFLRDMLGDDDEPHDTRADYRNWLAQVFGKEVGEVIARGLPRAAGADISSRAGEQDILPLSRFIADRREMKDRIEELALRSWGSPVSMVGGALIGASKMADGDYMAGLQMMVPKSISDVAKAYEMSQKGYRDEHGRQLPMDADPLDIAYQALGFKPQDKAEYTEENLVRATRKAQLQRRAGQLRDDLIDVIEHDPAAIEERMQDAARFGANQPAFSPLPTLGSTLSRRKQQELMARQQRAPLGYNPKDPGEAAFLGFGNY